LSRARSLSDGFLEAVNNWLGSSAGFYQAFLGSLAWLYFVFKGVDEHGFWYLFVATQVSFIGTFNLAIFARRSAAASDRASADAQAALARMEASDDADGEILLSLKQSLENQQAVLDAVVALVQDGIAGRGALAAALQTVDDEIEQLRQVADEARARHERNESLIQRIAEVFKDETP